MMRGKSRSKIEISQVSSASASTVWLVYAKVLDTTPQASSQPRWCSSMSRRMSSGMARTGWVSLSWTELNSAKPVRSSPWWAT